VLRTAPRPGDEPIGAGVGPRLGRPRRGSWPGRHRGSRRPRHRTPGTGTCPARAGDTTGRSRRPASTGSSGDPRAGYGRRRRRQQNPPLLAGVVEADKTMAAVADPWALLELARWCDRQGGTHPKEVHHVPIPSRPRPPPRRANLRPWAPNWPELPDDQRLQLLRVLGRMLTYRLSDGETVDEEGDHESH
jgi:hypothetical protein